MERVVSMAQATEEVDSWLKHKKVSDSKREEREDQIKTIVSAISEGYLSLDQAAMKFTQTLKFPFGKDVTFSQIMYLPRLPIDLIHIELKTVKSDDPDGRLLAHVAALTNMNKAVLRKMDSEDYSIAQAIAYFFL